MIEVKSVKTINLRDVCKSADDYGDDTCWYWAVTGPNRLPLTIFTGIIKIHN
jgi:hypothetical protein